MPSDETDLGSWFEDYELPSGAVSVRTHVLRPEELRHLEKFMAKEIPSCYLSSDHLNAQIQSTGLTAAQLIQNKIPDRGAVMAGDFGEILTLFFLSGDIEEVAKKVKKWRFKQDRTKAAPHSDVIILYKEFDDQPSPNDFVICAEAKLKSTSSPFSPIERSFEGYEKDKTGRLARTLVWLKEKAIDHEGAESVEFMKRFTDDLLDMEFVKQFRAVAVIDINYLDSELVKPFDLPDQSGDLELLVLGIDDLKETYQRSFDEAIVGMDSE